MPPMSPAELALDCGVLPISGAVLTGAGAGAGAGGEGGTTPKSMAETFGSALTQFISIGIVLLDAYIVHVVIAAVCACLETVSSAQSVQLPGNIVAYKNVVLTNACNLAHFEGACRRYLLSRARFVECHS